MKFDARTDLSTESRRMFVAWLTDQTVSTLSRAAGSPEKLKAGVFLYLHRAYEAGLPADEITDLFAVGATSVMSQAALSTQDEESVLTAFDELDGLIEEVYAQPISSQNALAQGETTDHKDD